MPDMVMDKYKQCQATCFSGVFPEIQYAWASIDNLLYIWDTTRYLTCSYTPHIVQAHGSLHQLHSCKVLVSHSSSRLIQSPFSCTQLYLSSLLMLSSLCRASVPVQWQEQQAICIAGLTKPKPNVFQQAVQYLMVVCTTVEVFGTCSAHTAVLPDT